MVWKCDCSMGEEQRWRIHRRRQEGGGSGGGVCVVLAAGWPSCWSRQGQSGNDEVIAKGRGGGSDIDSEMSSAAEAWALSLSPPSSCCCSVSLRRFGRRQCFVVTRESPPSVEWTSTGETPALADMVGDLFFWSFCCLRLWKRDKKVRLPAALGC